MYGRMSAIVEAVVRDLCSDESRFAVWPWWRSPECGSVMMERMKERFEGRFCLARCSAILALVFVLAPQAALAGEEQAGVAAANPHGNSAQCSACHVPAAGGQGPLRFSGNVLQLCQSCHDGRRAAREAHPVGMIPTGATGQKVPADFPLDEDGRLGCLTCHDITSGCRMKSPLLLRGGRVASPIRFCFRCHAEEDYRPFNVHDQLEDGKMKTDTCLWCHNAAPDVNAPLEGEASSTLRRQSSEVCRSCHTSTQNHPTGGPHLEAAPAPEMMWRMSAYEMQATMRLAFPQLLKYAGSTQRVPRSMPLDDRGRIACYTCHNPHEQGLWPARHPRAVGAEPKQATNHRLRVHRGRVCVACHEK